MFSSGIAISFLDFVYPLSLSKYCSLVIELIATMVLTVFNLIIMRHKTPFKKRPISTLQLSPFYSNKASISCNKGQP